MDTPNVNLEKYNKTGLRDAYGVLKHLEKIKTQPINERKGGKVMHDDEKVPEAEVEEQVTCSAPEEETPTTACDPADDPDLVEDEDEEGELAVA